MNTPNGSNTSPTPQSQDQKQAGSQGNGVDAGRKADAGDSKMGEQRAQPDAGGRDAKGGGDAAPRSTDKSAR